MSERRHYSGPDLATLLRRVDDELGSDAVIVKADRVRDGGVAGFFAREHYEVVASAGLTPSGVALTEPDADDELITSSRPSVAPTALLPPLQPVEPMTTAGTVVSRTPSKPARAEAPRRSIQAALLDRADQVSTEELLTRAAEMTDADRAGDSFRSILGRAVAVGSGQPVGSQPIENDRRGPKQAETGRGSADEPIVGLRPEPVRPGERVIEPMPDNPGTDDQPPIDDIPSIGDRRSPGDGPPRTLRRSRPVSDPGGRSSDTRDSTDTRDSADSSDSSGSADSPDDGWHRSGPHPGEPPPWAVDPLWSRPPPQSWSPPPWPVVGPPTSFPGGWGMPWPIHFLPPAPPMGPPVTGWWPMSNPEPLPRWADVRREIDEVVRARVDDIARAVRNDLDETTCDCGRSARQGARSVDRGPSSDRPPPPVSPEERRSGTDRRVASRPVENDRRRGDRRTGDDRRRSWGEQ